MKKETVPPIKLNDQAALDYTLYMMLTGCFKKTECKSQALEEQLYLRYRNQSSFEKEVLENICVGITDFFLPSKVPSEIWKYMVEIQLEKNPEDAFTTVIADGGFFVLRASAEITGARRALFCYSFSDDDGLYRSGSVTVRQRSPQQGEAAVSLEDDSDDSN